jgi:hypothetical protein
MHLHGIRRLWQKNVDLCKCCDCGSILVLQALFGFPLFKSFESDIKSDARVVIKDASGTCILEASDKIPRVIHNCPYDKEDIVTITYKKGSPDIRGHSPK